ncbi:Smr/MutS family protein [Pelagibacteraceae bacterium]|nr:Smr/MutS family protein [Pelagibacteraceae bacterium]
MEEDFFLKSMKGVKPFKKDSLTIKTKTTNKKNLKLEKKTNTKNTSKQTITKQKVISSGFKLSFGEVNKELKRGKINIDRRIDLHGYGLVEAHEKFISEVKKNYNKNKRCLLIITGKGVHKKIENQLDTSPKLFYGKIKNSIINWIKEDDLKKYILTYQDAGIEHGGDGALFVYLRKKKF